MLKKSVAEAQGKKDICSNTFWSVKRPEVIPSSFGPVYRVCDSDSYRRGRVLFAKK